MAKERRAQVKREPFAKRGDEIALQRAESGLQNEDDQQEYHNHVEQSRVVPAQNGIEQRANDQRVQQPQTIGYHQQNRRRDKLPAIRAQKRQHPWQRDLCIYTPLSSTSFRLFSSNR